jgi:hypothetical protein
MRLLVMAAFAASIVGCAPARQSAARDLVVGFESERPAARAEIRDGEAEPFLHRAAAVLEREGLRIAARTPTQLVTAPRESDFRCGVSACRARELAMVHVSGRSVRLEIVRAVRRPSDPRWQMALDPEAADETAGREARLLQAALGRSPGRIEISQR